MARASAPTLVERLVRHLVDGADDDPMGRELAGWLAESARFRRFAETNRDKIRKKLRSAADPEARLDVRAELRTARLLLADGRIELTFEPYGSGKGGPDYGVTYRGERVFNVEVTRRRGASSGAGDGGQLLAKLRQLPPSVPNAVLVAIEGDSAETYDVAAAMRGLRARAEANDEAFFTRRGLDGTRGFNQRSLRLGAVMVWCEGAIGDARANVWINRSARIAVPERAVRACLRCLRADVGT
jgi:hypothetical protein